MQTTFGLDGARAFSFRRCLWLCLPALLLGAVVRLSLLAAIPEVFYGSDSPSYFETAEDLYLRGEFSLPPKRRYVYPLLLVAAPAVPFANAAQVVAAGQHAAGLAMILGIGWITGHLVRRPALWVPPVTLLAAVWPRMLYYEHEMIGECLLLGAFIATVALAAPRGALADRRRLGWFLAMAVVIVAVKPAGRPLWLGLFLAALLITRNPLAWPRKFSLTVPAVILIALTSGGDGQGPWLFLSSTLPFIKTEGEPYARERALLRPAIEAARADLANYAFHQKHYKKMLIETGPDAKLGPEYVALAKDKARFSKVAKALGVPAVLAHPVQYAQLVGQKILIAASNRFHDRRLLPAEFWLDEAESVQGRWARHPGEMKLLYAMDEPAFRAVAAERARRTFWFEPQVRWFARVRWLTAEPGAPGMPPMTKVTWLGWLTLLGLAGALAPGRCARTSILWLPLPIYVCAVFAIGDRVSRYFQPIEWAMFILIAIGLDVVLDALAALWQSVRPAPTAAPTAAPEPAEGG